MSDGKGNFEGEGASSSDNLSLVRFLDVNPFPRFFPHDFLLRLGPGEEDEALSSSESTSRAVQAN